MYNVKVKQKISIYFHKNTKFKYSEKATKIWKDISLSFDNTYLRPDIP